jgi:hypothetical protein
LAAPSSAQRWSKSKPSPAGISCPRTCANQAGAVLGSSSTASGKKALGNEAVYKRNAKNGAGKDQYGVQLGDIRKLAAKIKANHELGLALWKTENLDARLLAILLLNPKKLSATELERMVRSAAFPWLADWLNSYVVKQHPDKEALREKWMKAKDPMAARDGVVAVDPQGLTDGEGARPRPLRAARPHRIRDGQGAPQGPVVPLRPHLDQRDGAPGAGALTGSVGLQLEA